MNFKRYNVAIAHPNSECLKDGALDLVRSLFKGTFNTAEIYRSEKAGVVAFIFPAEYPLGEKWIACINLGEVEFPQTVTAAMRYARRLRTDCLRDLSYLLNNNDLDALVERRHTVAT